MCDVTEIAMTRNASLLAILVDELMEFIIKSLLYLLLINKI